MRSRAQHLWHIADTNLTASDAGELDRRAASNWDKFYQQNKTNFFKDRHYLDREFPELSTAQNTVLEVGCGVGNTAYPLLELNKHSHVYACDFAPSAVTLVKAHPQYSCGRMHAFVADITCDDLRQEVPGEAVDICTMVFVLSAITPAKMPLAVANVARVLKPGTGRVLVRDYAEGDLAQLRLAGPTRNQRLSHNFYVRSDGTQAYYFTQESLEGLFMAAGFSCSDYKVHERQIENRRQDIVMHRRWVQAVFTYEPAGRTCNQPAASDGKLADHQPKAGTGSNAALQTDPPISNYSVHTTQQQAAATRDDDAPHRHQLPNTQTGAQAPGPGDNRAESQQHQSHEKLQSQSAPGSGVTSCSSEHEDETTAASCSPPQRQEWEQGGTDAEQERLTGCLFADNTPPEEVQEEVEIQKGVLVAQVVSVSRQHRHTLEHTGLMRWESALPLARLLLALPSLTQGRQVLEVGCGVSPLCCLAALRHCCRYVATDGSLQALHGLARNLDLNCRNLVMERARICCLAWGDVQQQVAITRRYGLFDVIVGADVVYAPEAIHSLFATCCALLSPESHARLVLCHIVRRVSEDSIVAVAAQFGFYLHTPQQACITATQQAIRGEPFRLLIFCTK